MKSWFFQTKFFLSNRDCVCRERSERCRQMFEKHRHLSHKAFADRWICDKFRASKRWPEASEISLDFLSNSRRVWQVHTCAHTHKSQETASALKKDEQVLIKHVCVCFWDQDMGVCCDSWGSSFYPYNVLIHHALLWKYQVRDRDLSVIAFLNSLSVCERSCEGSYSSSLSCQLPRNPCSVWWQSFLLAC